MANVRFYLNGKNNHSLIFARFNFNYYEIDSTGGKKYKSFKYSTGETINPNYWNKKTQRAKENSKFPQYPEFNQRLNDIENIIKNVFRQFLNDGKGNELTPELLKQAVRGQLKQDNKIILPLRNKGFLQFIERVIIDSRNGTRLVGTKGTRITEGTINSYNATCKNLLAYETDNKKTLKLSDITLDFYRKFVKYLNDKNRAVNTIGVHIKNIKLFMKIAVEMGLTDNREFEKKEFAKIEAEAQTIYLNETELKQIYDYDFRNNKKLDTVRDIFIIGCYTGLRFSDLQQLRKEHFTKDTINIRTIKTGDTVVIPLHWTVREICKKYDYNLPRVISNQKMNEYIKKIGELAGIKEKILITETRGGLKAEKRINKYELITVHTARRTFSTNMYKNDIPILRIMAITGHRTETAFLKYIKITPEENAQTLSKHPFFNQSKLLKVAN